jgi:hypothetical protein
VIGRAYSFRRWLADCLLGTRWSTVTLADSDIDRVSKELGLDPEFLVEVRAEAKIQRHKIGRTNALTTWDQDTGLRRRCYQFHLYMPEAIWNAWKDECEFRQVGGALLLRSLVHDYLLGGREVSPLKRWHWRGKLYRMGDNAKRSAFLERSTVPHGAWRALQRRGGALGVTGTALARALVIEALSGLRYDVPLVETGMMYDDESRYLSRVTGPDLTGARGSE